MDDTTRIERTAAHRPWPLPRGPWIMFQSWQQLLFMHWRVPAAVLRPHVPQQLVLEESDGSAWLGQTPFCLRGLRPRGLPALPPISDFPEMNLRTYVRFRDKPGIFFFTLDAASQLAVAAARALFRLPYRYARMRVSRRGEWIDYGSTRAAGDARFECAYRPVGPVFEPVPGTLEHFLTERYALYTVLRDGRVLRGDIHHAPWPLQPAEAVIAHNSVPAAHDIEVPSEAALLHYAERQDTLVWGPRLLNA